MKRRAFVLSASLLGACLLSISFSPSQRNTAPSGLGGLLSGSVLGGGDISAKAVRVEYIGNGQLLFAFSECHLVNTSVSQSLTLGEVFLLGPRGTSGPIITYTALRGTIVPPLGQVTLIIDNGIPGVQPWAGPRPAGGVVNAVFTWAGPISAGDLTAIIEDQVFQESRTRTRTVVTGSEFWP